jgi:hypothetical protein
MVVGLCACENSTEPSVCGLCACETSMESSVSSNSDCGGVASLEGCASSEADEFVSSIEVDGKSNVEAFSTVEVAETFSPLAGAKEPDNSRSKRSKGLEIFASGVGSVVGDFMVLVFEVSGTISFVEVSNEAQLFSLSCLILGVSSTATIAVSEA